MIDVHLVNQKSKESTYILTLRKKKMIDVHALKKKTKKVHRFLQWTFLRCKQKKVKKVNQKRQRFNQPITSTPHLI